MSYKFTIEAQTLLCSFAVSYWKEPLTLKSEQIPLLGVPLQTYFI